MVLPRVRLRSSVLATTPGIEPQANPLTVALWTPWMERMTGNLEMPRNVRIVDL